MCDYSMAMIKSRPAKVDDKLVVRNFGTGTRGFAPQDATEGDIAVCLLPGTEIAFDEPITSFGKSWIKTALGVMLGDLENNKLRVAIFRQINKDEPCRHHDALEIPDGKITLLTQLNEGQMATVLQLPAAPKTAEEAKEQERLAVVA